MSSSMIKEAQSENSEENSYYHFLLKLILRQIGIHKNLRQYYHPYEDATPYNTTTCKLVRFNKEFNILTTPFAHK